MSAIPIPHQHKWRIVLSLALFVLLPCAGCTLMCNSPYPFMIPDRFVGMPVAELEARFGKPLDNPTTIPFFDKDFDRLYELGSTGWMWDSKYLQVKLDANDMVIQAETFIYGD